MNETGVMLCILGFVKILISKDDPRDYKGAGIKRTMGLQKLANTAQVSFAECALLNNRNQSLTKANNEAKVRRSTKPVVLGKGKAKVMSFKDLEAAKDSVKSKGKRGRKRKNTELEASEAELEPEVEVVSSTKKVKIGKGTRVRRCRSTAVEAGEPEAEPEPQLEPQPEPQLEPVP
ncbi:hypothetical protein ACEPPN_000491 [Leptodophora sp. 'Broadleaf-Isolate-01']